MQIANRFSAHGGVHQMNFTVLRELAADRFGGVSIGKQQIGSLV